MGWRLGGTSLTQVSVFASLIAGIGMFCLEIIRKF
jgi:hypothetical protein